MISSRVLLLVDADEEVRGNGVGQLAGSSTPHRGNHRVVVQVVRELRVCSKSDDHAAHRRFDVDPCVLVLGAVGFTTTR